MGEIEDIRLYQIRDSGIPHSLLQSHSLANLQRHPKIGASGEGFALKHVIGSLRTRDACFWATHAGAKLDLLVRVEGKRYGFEFKYADAPGRHRSMHIALQDLHLDHLRVIYPGQQEYPLHDHMTVIPLEAVPNMSMA